MQAYNLQNEQVGYYHVVDGQKGAMLSPQTYAVPAGYLHQLSHVGRGDRVLRRGRACG